MEYDQEKVDDIVLALLYLGMFSERSVRRAWKSFDWDALNRLYERGLIGDPVNKAKSVILTEEGVRESERLFKQHFVTAGREHNSETNSRHG